MVRLAYIYTVIALFAAGAASAADKLRLDYAYYNPLSLVLKEERLLEKAGFEPQWVLSLGSNKALEFLAGNSIDFGSTAGAAALLAKINGSPIKSVYVYSRPEWTALVAPEKSAISAVKDLKGKRVAVTRGTDPHIFLLQALAIAGLGERDVKIVLLQHPDGRTALERGDVDAWAGLDPHMAQSELEARSRLFHRAPELNTWGVLNVREAYAAANPAAVERLLKVYEEARHWAIANPAKLADILARAAKIEPNVAARQLERTEFPSGAIGEAQRRTIRAAGEALQKAGVIDAGVDVARTVDSLIEARFVTAQR